MRCKLHWELKPLTLSSGAPSVQAAQPLLPTPQVHDGSFSLSTAAPAPPPAGARSFCPPLVQPSLRQRILQGADVDLSSLLRPSAAAAAPRLLDVGGVSLTLGSSESRASKILTVPEFALAFSTFRDVICAVFPARRQELDDYLSIILDMAVRYGGSGFYEYHRLFSAQAAARLQQWNIATYWGTLNLELYCRIFAGRPSLSCELCGQPSHPVSACSLVISAPVTAPSPAPPSLLSLPFAGAPSAAPRLTTCSSRDSRGRRLYFLGKQAVCNNFNANGCRASSCRFLHICSYCAQAHARPSCPHHPPKFGRS
ncbi:endothelial lipase [Astyanax mexicanus]|uniref:Endothelial lipase n=1 Tax=Astyanax mexicanus TaxID=7994 RepID=A0A8T2M040_ASTMX|nr:endothelial lipase [Astyanax mexicanus]